MRTYKKYYMGLIGCGHMGMAIARGAVAKEYLERYRIAVYDPNEEIQKTCEKEGYKVFGSAKEIIRNSHIVLLAVRPQDLDSALEAMQGEEIDCLLSIVTGVSIAALQEKLNGCPVIRAMPNTPLQISEGATAMCMSANCKADDYDFVFQLFNSMGVTRTLPESQLNEAVAINGSTPAYVYRFIQSLIKDAQDRGVDDYAARDLIVQTFIGAAELLKKDRRKPIQEFVDEVCSKGGTTIRAIETLEELDFDKIVHEANEQCITRAKELGEN
ncbi:MAG: pyrroline-5-carboxylate reductase [Solobacterium sp.]|nr:pyrroline-5-carboxylate reductase [Solobacterium sp.]